MSKLESWGVVHADDAELRAEVLAVPGMIDGRDLPLYRGTLEQFSRVWPRPFTVHRHGFYIEVTK